MTFWLSENDRLCGFANSRLVAVFKRVETYWTKCQGTEMLDPCEFLGRFVHHVLPNRLHKIRHVRLCGPAVRARTGSA